MVPGGVIGRLTAVVTRARIETMDDDLDTREKARTRRRDRELDAAQRDLMRPGMGKVFKQIQDSWGEKALPDQDQARKATKGCNRPR
jgi:hypothetical protein